MVDSYLVPPVSSPVRGSIRPPGSKSITNRALIVAALAEGTSQLSGVLDSDDTRVMIDSLQKLGATIEQDIGNCTLKITGLAGGSRVEHADLWLQNSGTSIRFLTALCALGHGEYRLDGNARMRERPIQDLVDALNGLGARVDCELESACPPVRVVADGLAGGTTSVAGNISSQYLSALLMAAPCARTAVEIRVSGELVSRPYIDMTAGVMAKFGARIDSSRDDRFVITPQQYRACQYAIEPDASAASYFFAAAAITQGEVTVEGLSRDALQGDVHFVDALQQMGCDVQWEGDRITVCGRPLHGIDIDMNAISDTAQTLAVVAPFAEGPTRIRGVAHMRHKETDRVEALTIELRRLGLEVDEFSDGLLIHPGVIRPTTIATYDDHRMAMSFALIGLRVPGIRIADPGCTAKTYPHYFEDLQRLCGVTK